VELGPERACFPLDLSHPACVLCHVPLFRSL
jgi:hypothetical protein